MPPKASALLLALAASLPLPAFAAEGSHQCGDEDANLAFARLHVRIQREHLYAGHARGERECVFYEPQPCDSMWVHVSVHERHDEVCGGDPATAPALDHFRVHRKTGLIEWVDFTSGDYVPFEYVCTYRPCAKSAAPPPRPATRE
jgi:hypothetical protein